MASFSGNFSGTYAYSVLYLDYSYSQDINTNKTTFNYNLRIQKNASTTQSYQANCPFGLNIGGKNLGGTFNLDLRNVGVYGSQTIKSGSLTFDHNDSGKLSNISCSASVDTSTSLGDASLSGSVPIPDIPRASKFGTIENFNIEGTIVIPLTKYVDEWIDNLTIKLDDTIIRTIDGVVNNQEVVFTEEEKETIYNLMPEDNKKTFTFENVTLNGDTQIGSTQTTTAEGTITEANPVLTSFEYEDSNEVTLALTNNNQKIINGKSTLRIKNLMSNAVKGASLKLVQVNGIQYTYTDDFSVDIENYKGNAIILYVIDSRNNSSKLEVLIGINFIDYSEPVIKNKNIERKNYIDEVSELSVDGTFANINFGGTNNTLTAVYKYKETGSINWNDGLTNLEIDIDNNLFNIDQAIKGDTSSGFDTTNSYDIKIIINDLLTTKEESITLIAGKPAMDVYKDKISFGGIADEISEFQTQFKDKANFENGIYVNGEEFDVIDNLTSTSTTNALSANMGRELNEKHNWKLYAATTGTGTTNLPTNYNELYIEISRTGYTDPIMSLYIPRASLTASARAFRKGYYFNSSVHGAFASLISLTTYKTVDLYISGTAYNSTALTNIYYR